MMKTQMKIRYHYINNLLLNIYQKLDHILFPIDPHEIIGMIPNCRFLSYAKFAEINQCSIEDVINICESKSGCTHYDILNDRYLILCNQNLSIHNNLGRQRWTCSHEIAHVICGHLTDSAYVKLSENGFAIQYDHQFEREADFFAATLLAPFPLFQPFHVGSSYDVRKTFGLSKEASDIRYSEYQNWKKFHYKTAWENRIVKTYYDKLSNLQL